MCSHLTKLLENVLENQHRKTVLKDDCLAIISCNKEPILKNLIFFKVQRGLWNLTEDHRII